jgi:hypothetical protein
MWDFTSTWIVAARVPARDARKAMVEEPVDPQP